MASSCKKGYYFCNSSQKCKRIPRGHKVLGNGELVREYVSDWRSDLQMENAAGVKNITKKGDKVFHNGRELSAYGASQLNKKDGAWSDKAKREKLSKANLTSAGSGLVSGVKATIGDHYDWRSELQEVSKEYIDKKQSQFKKDYGIQSNPLNIPSIQKANNEKLAKHKLGGKSFEMTGDGQNINFGKWGEDQAKEVSKRATSEIDKRTKIATDSKYASRLKSHGTSADEIKKGAGEWKSNIKKGGEEAAWRIRREINKHTPGTPEHQTVGVEKDIAFNTDKFKPKKKGLIQNKVVKTEELQGGVSVEPYTKDTKFLEVETVDIIKPKALNASDWRSELEVVNEGSDVNEVLAPLAVAAGGLGVATYGGKLMYDAFKDRNKNKKTKVKKEKLSNWRNEGVKYYTGSDRNSNTGYPKGLKPSSGGSKEVKPLTPEQNRMLVKGKKKETVSASYEAALNDLVVEILKYDIEDLHNIGFSYEEIAEYYDVNDEVVNLNEGVGGVGLRILKAVAPKIRTYIANRAVKDSKTVVNWARKPGNWKALNKNIDKVTLPVGKALKELPARTYAAGRNFRKAVDATYNAGKALRGATTNALSSAKKNLLPAAKGRLKNVTDAGTRFSNFVDKAYSSLEKNVGQKLINRGRQDIAIRNLDKAKINKTKEIFAKVKKLEKKGDVAGDVIDVTKTTKYKKPGDPWNWFPKKPQPQKGIPKPSVDRTNKSLNPAGGALTAIKDKGSALVSKVRNFFSKKGTKQLTGTKTPNKLSGTNIKGSLPSGSSKVTKPYSSKRELAKGWTAYNKAADATLKADKASAIARTSAAGLLGLTAGGKVGQEIGKKLNNKKVDASSQSQVSPPPLEQPKVEIPKVKKNTVVPKNKTISNTEKKKVDPKKNPVVSKVVDTYHTSKKDTKSKNVDQWGRSKQYTAKDGTVVDRSNVFTKAEFDLGPNIKKGQKIGVVGHGTRKRYDLEATRRKNVKEGAAVLARVGSKLPWNKIVGAAMTGIGASGMIRQSKKGDVPADIKKQMDDDKSIDVPGIPMGNPDLEKHFGTKKTPKSMKDKYDKDALDNAKTDSILDPSGTQKTKPTLKQLRDVVKTRNKEKTYKK